MRTRKIRWLLPSLAGPVLGLVVIGMTMAGPTEASTKASTQSGMAAKDHAATSRMAIRSASKAGVAGYLRWEPGTDPTTTYNSTGGQVFVTQLSAGDTLVTFAGITGNGGDAQVSTPITNASCSVEFVTPVAVNAKPGRQATTEHAFLVQCYDQSGTQTDEPFDLLVTHAPSHPQGVLDYALVYKKHGSLNSDPRFRPFEFNSAGKTNSVSHPRTGVYLVTMPGSGSAGNDRGTVSVSPVGAGAGNCQIATWRATKTAQTITVACFGATGAPLDRQFTIAYARGNNLMGRGGLTDANAAVRSGGSVYQPSTQFDSVPKAKITVAHTNPGQYVVLFGGSRPTGGPNGGNGHIQVTAAGSRPRHCGYTIIPTPTPELDVNCAAPGGILTDSAFTVQWVVNH